MDIIQSLEAMTRRSIYTYRDQEIIDRAINNLRYARSMGALPNEKPSDQDRLDALERKLELLQGAYLKRAQEEFTNERLAAWGVPPRRSPEPQKPGENAVFRCSCGRHEALGYTCGELHVIPIKVGGEKRIDLRTAGIGGVVLSNQDRVALMAILADGTWFGV